MILCLSFLLFHANSRLAAQDIPIKNPSVEGPPRQGVLPPSWLITSQTPDTRYGTKSAPASDGSTYIGAFSNGAWNEGFCQELESSLQAGLTYSISFDLAYPALYQLEMCYATLAIYGGNAPADTAVCFWRSGEIYHTDWNRYTVTFTPTQDCRYISFWPYVSAPCEKSKNSTAVLVDNFSSHISIVPRLSLTTRHTCTGAHTGQVAVSVTGAAGPYTYKWFPGGETTDRISDLPAGNYKVTVTAANGLTAAAQATVQEDNLVSHARVTAAKCVDQPENSITVNTTGGIPPYRYYLNGSSNGTYTPVFPQLPPGSYHILVKDERGCSATLHDIAVSGPQPLVIQQAAVIPATCGKMANGRIIPLVQGGTRPYAYQVDNGPWQPDSVLRDLGPGYHSFNVKDKYQCSTSGAASVATQWQNCLVVMPTAFSPNGDGINDVFRPRVYDNVRNYQLTVYNRWGGLVFRSSDPHQGWDGTYKGLLQEVQGFTYICTFHDRNNMRQELKGGVALVQ